MRSTDDLSGSGLTTFSRRLAAGPRPRELPCPVLLWESITRRAEHLQVTAPGVRPTRPHPGEPLVFLVQSTRDVTGAAPVTIGRTRDSDIVIDDDTVSRSHALLRLDEQSQGWLLLDAGSKNGTFVRGERLVPQVPFALTAEEQFVIGSVSVRFLTPEAFFRYLDAMIQAHM